MSQLRPPSCRRFSITAALGIALFVAVATGPAAAAPSGQLTWAVHISLAPTWFDPAETPSLITPFMVLYAMHDALVKFTPGAPQGKSLGEAGYPGGFDGGSLSGEMIYGSAIGEPVTNYLQAVGIRTRLRLLERAAFYKEYAEKKLSGLLHTGSGAPGNAATRIDAYAVTGGTYVYNTYPEIDGLFSEQVNEQNPRVRTQILHKIQQIIHERVMFAPVMEPAFLNGVGPRVEYHGLGAIANFPYTAPYEDLTIKAK